MLHFTLNCYAAKLNYSNNCLSMLRSQLNHVSDRGRMRELTMTIPKYQSNHCPLIDVAVILHYNDAIMTTIASQLTSLTSVCSTVYSDADQRKYQSSASLAFVWGIHRDRWIPRTKGQLRGKCFHLMTSSCKLVIFNRITDKHLEHFPWNCPQLKDATGSH